MLAKPMLGVAKEYTCNGVFDVSTDKGFPSCFEFPWERDPANFGIGINFSEVAATSEGKDSRTLLQNEVKRVQLLAKRFLQEAVLRSKQPRFFWLGNMKNDWYWSKDPQLCVKPVLLSVIPKRNLQLYAKLICGKTKHGKLLQSDETHWLELLLSLGTMNKAHTATLGSFMARLWRFTLRSLIDFSLTIHILLVCLNAVETESVPQRISQNKPSDLRQGGAAAHGSTNSIKLYLSQDLRSPDQFSAEQTQPVHLQQPTCHSNMSLLYGTLSMIFHAIRAYRRLPSFHARKAINRGAVLLKFFAIIWNMQWWHVAGQAYVFMHDATKMETSS